MIKFQKWEPFVDIEGVKSGLWSCLHFMKLVQLTHQEHA